MWLASPYPTGIQHNYFKVAPEIVANSFFFFLTMKTYHQDGIYLHKTDDVCIDELFPRGKKQKRGPMSYSAFLL